MQQFTEFFIFCGIQYSESDQTLEDVRIETILRKQNPPQENSISFRQLRQVAFLKAKHVYRHVSHLYWKSLLSLQIYT